MSLNQEKAATRFLCDLGHVSSLLGINESKEKIFQAEDQLDYIVNPGDLFIKIVTYLQMNIDDPGLYHLRDMASLASKGVNIRSVVSSMNSRDIHEVISLCKDVMTGITYELRDVSLQKTHSDDLLVANSFIEFLSVTRFPQSC